MEEWASHGAGAHKRGHLDIHHGGRQRLRDPGEGCLRGLLAPSLCLVLAKLPEQREQRIGLDSALTVEGGEALAVTLLRGLAQFGPNSQKRGKFDRPLSRDSIDPIRGKSWLGNLADPRGKEVVSLRAHLLGERAPCDGELVGE